jgi:putative hemolysin
MRADHHAVIDPIQNRRDLAPSEGPPYIRAMLYLEIAVIAALICINGLLAMAELSVVSSRRARLRTMVERDVVGSRRALALASDPGKFLSTVQIGITLVGVLSGAFSGATLGYRVSGFLASFGVSPAAADTLGVALVVALITYASLIIGELVPKQVALRNPERIAVKVAPAMTVLAKIASPLVWLLERSGRIILRALGFASASSERVTDEEIRTLVAEAETAGVIRPGERQMIAGVMRLGDRAVRGVMTPRRDVDMIGLSDDPETIRMSILESAHSCLPVHEGTPDTMLGVVQAKDLLDACLRGEQPDVRSHIRMAPTVPDTINAMDVVDVIKASPVHLALIHDEYGDFVGIVTNADILEAVAGSFGIGDGLAEQDAVEREDGSWLIAGSMPADEMADRFALPLPGDRDYHTAAGFALHHFGRLPEVGDSFDANGWHFEVVDLDERRIDRLLAHRIAPRARRAATGG